MIGGNAITGGIGSVITATTLAGTLSTPVQDNITKIGTLESLTMGGDININNNSIIGGVNSSINVGSIVGALSGTADSAVKLSGTVTIAGTDLVFLMLEMLL